MAFHFSRRKTRPREAEDVGELNIVPYLDIMMNLNMFMLLSMTGLASFGVLNVAAPKYGTPAQAVQDQKQDKPKLMLTVAIAKTGFYLAGSGAVLAGAQAAPSQGPDANTPPTVPLKNGAYDYDGLTNALVQIKNQYPDESKVIITADASIPYDILVQTMDSARETKGKMLFFDVSLSTM